MKLQFWETKTFVPYRLNNNEENRIVTLAVPEMACFFVLKFEAATGITSA